MRPKSSPLKLPLLEMPHPGFPWGKSSVKKTSRKTTLHVAPSTAVRRWFHWDQKVVKEEEHTEERGTPSAKVRP